MSIDPKRLLEVTRAWSFAEGPNAVTAVHEAAEEIQALRARVAELEAECASEATEADRLNVITGEQGERIAYLERTLAAARVEGVRLGLEAAARVCLALGAGKLDPAKGAAFAAWKKMIAEECTLVVLALDPAAVAKGGTRE